MAQIAILKSTGIPQGDMIFKGVYGALRESAGSNQHTFVVASELIPVSSVFGYLDGSLANESVMRMLMNRLSGSASANERSAQVSPLDMAVFTVDGEEKATAIRDALMLKLDQRWSGMYKSFKQESSGFLELLLNGEAAAVRRGVDQHFSSQGKSRWLVPVKATMATGADGGYFGTEKAVLELLNSGSVCTNLSVVEDMPVRRWTEGDTAPATDVYERQPDLDATSPAWSEFFGFEADVIGHVQVMAMSEAGARLAAQSLIEFDAQAHEQMGPGFAIQVKAAQITACRQMVYGDAVTDAMDHDDDDGDGDDDDDQSVRNSYRFS